MVRAKIKYINENFPQKFAYVRFSAYNSLSSGTIWEKTNDGILRKSKESPFLGPFCVNLGKREFWAPSLLSFYAQLHAKYQKTLMSQFREKLPTNGRTDGSTEFIGPSRYARGPKKMVSPINDEGIPFIVTANS